MMVNGDGLRELPRGWVCTRVGDIYDIVGGGTPSTKVERYWDGDIPWITSADIHGLGDIRPRRRITEEGIENSATKLVPARSIIVVTRVGLGKLALTNQPLCFSQDSQALVGNNDLIFPDYSLYYLSQAVQVFRYRHRGTTIAGVTKKRLSELPFALPPLAEQQRIVAKIEELFTQLDAGVAALEMVRAQLRRYRQAVLKAAVDGQLTKEWREANKGELELASVLLDRITEERRNRESKVKELPTAERYDVPELPEGWVWAKLGNIISSKITKGSTPTSYGFSYEDEGIKFITTENINEAGTVENITRFIDEEANEFLRRSILQPQDILISIAGTIGRVGVVQEKDIPANTNQALAIVRCFWELVDNRYIFYLLRAPLVQKQASDLTVGVGRANLSLTNLAELPIPLPPLAEQIGIVEEIEHRFSVADAMENSVKQSLIRADRLRQSILKQAFEGKLVAQDPTDEPASTLLERIKAEKASREADKKPRKRTKKTGVRNRKKIQPQQLESL